MTPAEQAPPAEVRRLLFRSPVSVDTRPAVFLDRDGVINVDRRYVYRIDDFEFKSGVLSTCRDLTRAGYALVVVTNQAGIARGYYGFEEFGRLCEWMDEQFVAAGAPLDGVYFCPHHPDGVVPSLRRGCGCRKPEPGLILAAAADLRLDLARSTLVGDKLSDILAGRRAGVGRCVLVGLSSESESYAQDLGDEVDVAVDAQVGDLPEAGALILAT